MFVDASVRSQTVDRASHWENTDRVRDYNDNASFQQNWYRDLLGKVTQSGRLQGTVLDVGCSSGIFVHEQACQYPDVTFHGLDYSSKMIEKAKGTYSDQSNVHFFQGDAQNLKGVSGLRDQYNLILAATVLHWIPNQAAALKSMYAQLAPGGQIVVRTFDHEEGTPFVDPAIAHLQAQVSQRKLPFAIASQADYMGLGKDLGVDHMRFEPATVTLLLPLDDDSAKEKIGQWLDSWYETPEGLDPATHRQQMIDGVLLQSALTEQGRLLPFHFVDLIIEKYHT